MINYPERGGISPTYWIEHQPLLEHMTTLKQVASKPLKIFENISFYKVRLIENDKSCLTMWKSLISDYIELRLTRNQ